MGQNSQLGEESKPARQGSQNQGSVEAEETVEAMDPALSVMP